MKIINDKEQAGVENLRGVIEQFFSNYLFLINNKNSLLI